MAGAWSQAWVYEQLGKPLDWWPSSEEEGKAFMKQAIGLLATEDTKSGYMEVFLNDGGKSWQAKPYIRPGVQRGLGSFPTKERAAEEILLFKIGHVPPPPTPKKRRRRGEARAPRVRRRGMALPTCRHSHCPPRWPWGPAGAWEVSEEPPGARDARAARGARSEDRTRSWSVVAGAPP